jgi:hypothetical protein
VLAGLERLEIRRLFAAPHVYVNDDWQVTIDVGPPGISGGDSVQAQGSDSNVGAHTIGLDAFTTIADGITNVTPGGIVSVVQGVYPSVNTTIDKPMTLDGVAGPGSVIITPNSPDGRDDSAFDFNAQQGLLVSSSDVTISDLTIDGGVDQDFRQGIITDFRNNTVYNNITISGVNVQNIIRRGIEIYSSNGVAAPKSTGVFISGCHVNDVAFYEGILLFDADATVSGNVIGNCSVGLACNTLHGVPNAPLLQVLGNTINGDASRAVIGMNLSGLAEGSYVGDVNVFNQAGGSVEPDTGLIVQFPFGQVTVATNRFFESEADSGIFLYAATNPAKPVLVEANSFTSTPTNQNFDGDGVGIFMTDDGQFFDVTGNNACYATITGNTVSGFTHGIDLFRAGNGAPGGAIVQATINNNNSTGGFNQIRVFDIDGPTNGYNAIATIVNDSGSITGDNFGLDIDGGQATLTGNVSYARGTAVRVIDQGSLTVDASGALLAGAMQNDATFVVNGSANLLPIDGSGNTTLGANAFLLADHVRQSSLVEGAGAITSINNNGGPVGVSNLKSLSLNATARLDLTNNDMVIDYSGPSPANTIRQLLRNAYNNGAWNAPGLTSSSAAGSSHHAAIGFAQSTDLYSTFPQTFSGQTVDNTSVLLKYTVLADANLDAVVATEDFNFLAANFGGTGKRWSQGDFNYDGSVDTIDFNLLSTTFGAVFSQPALMQQTPAAKGVRSNIFSDTFVHNADREGASLLAAVTA